MTWTDVATLVGLVLAIGAAFDVTVRKKTKASFAKWIARVTTPSEKLGYNGSKILDRIFGQKLLSTQAAIRYSAISLLSITISYVFALLTTAPEGHEQIYIFSRDPTGLDIALLIICVGFAIIGDIASYAQTRLFFRTVDSYKNGVVTIGLVIADIITSLSLFFISFSFARIICYILILQFTTVPPATSQKVYVPSLISTALKHQSIDITLSQERQKATQLAIQISNAVSKEELQHLARNFKALESAQLSGPERLSVMNYSARRICANGIETYKTALNAIDESANLIKQAYDEHNLLSSRRVSLDALESEVENLRNAAFTSSPKNCRVQLLIIERSVPVHKMVNLAGPANSYFAAAERTMMDAYSVLAYKLAPYIGVNPYSDVAPYLQSLRIMVENTLLGVTAPNSDKVSIFNLIDENQPNPKGRLNIPFSPMVASSLTSSAIFLLYVGSVGLAVFRRKLLKPLNALIPAFDLDKAVFTTFSLALSASIFAAMAISSISTLAWNVLIG